LPLVGLVVSAAITAEFPQGCNLPYSIFGGTKVKLERFFENISHKDTKGEWGKKFTTEVTEF